MKQAGITRRMDNLGRIVIPKEIRKNMGIKKGELLEIYINDEDSIILKKHTIMSKKDEFINIFLKTLAQITNSNIYVTNLNNIIYSSNNEIINKEINSNFLNIITKDFNNLDLSEINITKDQKILSPFKIFPIIPNGDLIGTLVVDYKDLVIDDQLFKFCLSVIENYFENN